jgi:hypothetical protein
MPRLTLMLLPFSLLGCSAQKVTEIVVVIASDIPVAGAQKTVNKLNLQIHYPRVTQQVGELDDSTRQVDYTWDLDPAVSGAITLPATVGLIAGKDLAQPVLVTVRGLLEQKEQIRRQAQLLFAKDRIVMLRMNLLKRCLLPVSCEARATCGESGCEPIVKDSSTLPGYEEGEAKKPYLDAGPRDAPGDRPRGDSLLDGPRFDGPGPDAPAPSDLKPELSQPDAAKLDAKKPDGPKLDQKKPLDGPKPDKPKPDLLKPDGTAPATTYKLIATKTAVPLRGLSVVGAMGPTIGVQKVVFVGDGCTIVECAPGASNKAWDLVCGAPIIESGCTANLRGVSALVGMTGSLAVGDGGTILRRNAIGWFKDTSGTSATLRAVLADGTPIAVGNGVFLEYATSAWSLYPFAGQDLQAVARYGSYTWAVAAAGRVFEKSTPSWTIVGDLGQPLHGIAGGISGAGIRFTVAGELQGKLFSYSDNPAAWFDEVANLPGASFRAIQTVPAYTMLGGFRVAAGSGGAIVRSNLLPPDSGPSPGTWASWTPVSSPTTSTINAVGGNTFAFGHVYLATEGGQAFVLCPSTCQ